MGATPKTLEEKIARFKIGDDVSIVGGMGDWDNGVVTGVYVKVTYRILTEYGTEWHVESEKVVGPIDPERTANDSPHS